MRTVLALVVLATACDGGAGSKTPDAAVMVDADVVPPDAPPAIDGTWKDNYYTTSGTVTQAACTTAPVAYTLDATTGTTTMYSGACKADGTFKIDNIPSTLGTYFLRINGAYYETDRRAGIDLSTDKLGRNDVAAITGVTYGFNLTNLQAWTSGDLLFAFAPNIGYRQNLGFTANPPAVSDTTLTATSSWNGYKVDSTKGDTVLFGQLGKHTANSYDFVSLDRIYNVPAFSMANNAQVAVTGAFTTATNGQLSLSINADSFNQFSGVAGPTVSAKSIQGSLYAAVTSDVIDSPPLLSFAQSSEGQTSMSFGTLFYTDPFAAAWQRMVKVTVGFSVPFTWNNTTGSMNAQFTRVLTKAQAQAAAITANLGPVTDLKFDGTDAFTATSISGVPLLTWNSPSTGTPTDYEVQVFEAKTSSGSLTFSSVLRMVTKQTSLKIPQGSLLGQRQYVFLVRARNRGTVDVYATPLRNGDTWSSADVLTALVTTGS